MPLNQVNKSRLMMSDSGSKLIIHAADDERTNYRTGASLKYHSMLARINICFTEAEAMTQRFVYAGGEKRHSQVVAWTKRSVSNLVTQLFLLVDWLMKETASVVHWRHDHSGVKGDVGRDGVAYVPNAGSNAESHSAIVREFKGRVWRNVNGQPRPLSLLQLFSSGVGRVFGRSVNFDRITRIYDESKDSRNGDAMGQSLVDSEFFPNSDNRTANSSHAFLEFIIGVLAVWIGVCAILFMAVHLGLTWQRFLGSATLIGLGIYLMQWFLKA